MDVTRISTPNTVDELLAAARGLFVDDSALTPDERALFQSVRPLSESACSDIRRLIAAGEDPLGSALCALRTREQRRATGAIYTQPAIVRSMVDWAAEQTAPDRVVDPGSGSGRFLLAAGRRFPAAELVAIDTDPLALILLRAGAEVLGLTSRLRVYCEDYRQAALPIADGRTLFLGNPPYLRHHDIPAREKTWLAVEAKRYGLKASKLAGLHAHFFLRTARLAQAGDIGAFITSSEWLDTGYGSLIRGLLTGPLGGASIHVLAADAMPFADATTTGAIITFHPGRAATGMEMRMAGSVSDLGSLRGGRYVAREQLTSSAKWSLLPHAPRRRMPGHIELGELFDVHRGQVTGNNHVWIAGAYPEDLPARILRASVTKAKDIIDAGLVLRDLGRLKRVIDLPVDLDVLSPVEREQVERFLIWARTQGADTGYVATHRKAWWSVGLYNPAPMICTYMGRRPPVFVLNPKEARHLNISHGLFPREPMPSAVLEAAARFLNANVSVTSGRTYAGKLTKFEPGEIQRLLIPGPRDLDAAAA